MRRRCCLALRPSFHLSSETFFGRVTPDFTSASAAGEWSAELSQESFMERCSFKRCSSHLAETCFQQGSFARPALPGVFTTMSPSDSRTNLPAVIDSRRKLMAEPSSERVSQVPRLICRCPPSPTTPESPVAALARCFAAGVGFTLSGGLATLTGLTRPNRVHLRYG